jgi:hypothetical protein
MNKKQDIKNYNIKWLRNKINQQKNKINQQRQEIKQQGQEIKQNNYMILEFKKNKKIYYEFNNINNDILNNSISIPLNNDKTNYYIFTKIDE